MLVRARSRLSSRGRPARVGRTSVRLARVQYEGQVGSILRSAAAAGVERVFCAPGTASAWSSKVPRSACRARLLL
ncbi:hypothetical protein CF642_38305, partial [Burkholderia pseudomallei]